MLPQADDCPFCDEQMKWRKDKWIHPGQQGCIMIGIGLENKRQVRLWNTRGGVKPTTDEDVNLFLSPVEPSPPPPPPVEDWLASFRMYHKHKNHTLG
jgi:hypothetical protein